MPNITQSIKDNISITEYAQRLGYHIRQVSVHRWTLVEHDSININIDPRHPGVQRFIWNSRGVKGSVIDFAMEIRGCNQQEAIAELRKILGGQTSQYWQDQREKRRAEYQARAAPTKLELPPMVKGNPARVYAYLTKTRGISPKIVSQLFRDKTLYQDQHGNAAFIGMDYDGQPGYCCYRGTLSNISFRGEMRGSRKEVSFSMGLVGEKPTRLMVFEAPIDAMSAATMLDLCGRNYKDYAYLSLGGTAVNALEYHLQRHPQLQVVFLCQDADTAGLVSRQKCRDMLAQKSFAGRVIDKLPTGKDFNEDLLAMRRAHEQIQELRIEPQI